MGDVVSLRRVRRVKQRQDEADAAAARRLLHGVKPADRRAAQAEQRRAARLLDAANLSPPPKTET